MPNEIDIKQIFDRSAVQKNIQDTKNDLEEVVKSMEHLLKLGKEYKPPKTIAENSAAIDRHNKSLSEHEKLVKSLETANKKRLLVDTQVNKELQKTRQETNKANREIRKSTSEYGKLTVSLQKAEDAYRNLAASGTASTAEIRASQKQVQALRAQIDAINEPIKRNNSNVGRYFEGIAKYFNRVAGVLGLAYGASQAFDFAKQARELALQAKGVDFAFQRIEGSTEALREAIEKTQGSISELEIQKAINKFSNFGLEIEALPELLEFVSVRAAQTGESFDHLFDSLVEGLAKESKLRIDNLGISVTDLNKELEKSPSFLSAVAAIAKREVAEAGDILNQGANAQQRFNAAVKDAKLIVGQYVSDAIDPLIVDLAKAIKRYNEFNKSLRDNAKNAEASITFYESLKLELAALGDLFDGVQKFVSGFDAKAAKANGTMNQQLEIVRELIAPIKFYANGIAELRRQVQAFEQAVSKGKFKQAIQSLNPENIRDEAIKGFNEPFLKADNLLDEKNKKLFIERLNEITEGIKLNGEEIDYYLNAYAGDKGISKEAAITESGFRNLLETVSGYTTEIEKVVSTSGLVSSSLSNTTSQVEKQTKSFTELTLEAVETLKQQRNQTEENISTLQDLKQTTNDPDLLGFLILQIQTLNKELEDIDGKLRGVLVEAIQVGELDGIGTDGLNIELDTNIDFSKVKPKNTENLKEEVKQLADEITEYFNLDAEKPFGAQLAAKLGDMYGGDILDTIFDNQRTRFEEESQKRLEILDTEEEAIAQMRANGAINEEQYILRKTQIESKRRAEERKAVIEDAKFAKKKALYEIALNTAIAIAKVLPNFAAIPFIAATAAAQTAIVSAQKIPKYKTGLKSAKQDHIGIVGDAGRELIETPQGVFLAEKETPFFLPKGSSVKTNTETERILNNQELLFEIKDLHSTMRRKKLQVVNHIKFPDAKANYLGR